MIKKISILLTEKLENIKRENYRLFIVTNYIYIFAFIAHFFLIIYFISIGIFFLFLFNIGSCIAFIFCFYINRKGYHKTAIAIGSAEIIIHGILCTIYLGWDSGFHYFIPALVPFIFFAPSKSNLIKIILTVTLVLIYSYLNITYMNMKPLLTVNEVSIDFLNYLNIMNLFIALAFLGYYYPKATRETEAKLEKSEAKYRAVVEDQTELICRYKKDGTYTFVNEAFSRYFNIEKNRILNKKFDMNTNPDDLYLMEEMNKKLTPANTITEIIVRINKDDSTHWIKWIISAIFDKSNKLVEYQGVGQDITEQKKAEENLKKTLIKLERSNKELEQFAFVASHDLKSPLNVVTSYIDIINRNYADKMKEEDLEMVEMVKNRIDKMREMIDNLLSYSRISTEGAEFKKCNVNNVLKDAIENLHLLISEKNAIIKYDSLPELIGDETQLVSVFQNLIGNAVKYCNKNQPIIHIKADERDKDWMFSVIDNGNGIREKYKDKIFMLFQRGGKSKASGNGIGLAFCKKIVERHNGSIWFDSKWGEGTTFYFTIEKKKVSSKLYVTY